jgi:hypothetical protein
MPKVIFCFSAWPKRINICLLWRTSANADQVLTITKSLTISRGDLFQSLFFSYHTLSWYTFKFTSCLNLELPCRFTPKVLDFFFKSKTNKIKHDNIESDIAFYRKMESRSCNVLALSCYARFESMSSCVWCYLLAVGCGKIVAVQIPEGNCFLLMESFRGMNEAKWGRKTRRLHPMFKRNKLFV